MHPPNANMKILFLGLLCIRAVVSQDCQCEYGCNTGCPDCCMAGTNDNTCANPLGCCNPGPTASSNATTSITVQTKHQRKRQAFCPLTTTPTSTAMQNTTTPAASTSTPTPTVCQPADSAWLFHGNGADAWYINLNPQGNFGNSFADCNNKITETVTNTFTKVRVAVGIVLGSTFVVVNGTDATYREGASHANCPITYPAWGQSDGCSTHNEIAIDLTDTPFSLALGSTSFKTFDEIVFGSHIDIQCTSGDIVCSGVCGGDCGGCSAGPHGFVLLQVSDQRAFDCGILAHSNTTYVCKDSMCVRGKSNFNLATCESLCQT